MGREFELKFAGSPEILAAIGARYGDFETIAMETTYYDTPARVLSQRHITLRRRMENGVAVCTVKTPNPDGSRGEWETECNDITAGIEILCKLGAPPELLHLTRQGVEAICGARFTRRAKGIRGESFEAELALDLGVLLGGGRELPLSEVEVELKSGHEAAAATFARDLAREFGLRPEKNSKFRRALSLTER